MAGLDIDRVKDALAAESWVDPDLDRLVDLMVLFADLPPPPDPEGIRPRYPELLKAFLSGVKQGSGEVIEESFLALYAHVHGFEVPYSPQERRAKDEVGGYWNHAGGLEPILKAQDHLRPKSVSGDFGAGNGLQCLLMQKMVPHLKTIQIEISSAAIEDGRNLQSWLEIDPQRVEWCHADVRDVSPQGMDFVYLYRPVRPEGRGRNFYQDFSTELEKSDQPVVIFSIADCLREFLPPRFEIFYTDGHLTCFRG